MDGIYWGSDPITGEKRVLKALDACPWRFRNMAAVGLDQFRGYTFWIGRVSDEVYTEKKEVATDDVSM